MPRHWAIFLITSANFFLSQFYRASMAVIAPELLQDLSRLPGGVADRLSQSGAESDAAK